MDYDLRLTDVVQTRERIAPYVRHTPLLSPPALHTDVPTQLRLKLENLQVSGSFKARGAFNNLLQLTPEQRQRGIIVASGGNHGLAIAYAARRLAIPATVYLPETANPDRAARITAMGANVVLYGDNPSDAIDQAASEARRLDKAYIHPFDGPATHQGTGTLGLELLDDQPDLDCVVVAIGGGGLIGGAAAALKQLRPGIRVIGVEPAGAAKMLASVNAGRLVELPEIHTIADTLSPRAVSERTLALTQRYVDQIATVSDEQMIAAMRWLWVECNQLVEPAGAAVIAAILSGAADLSEARHPVAVICGGNAAAESVFSAYQHSAELVALEKTAH